MKIKNQVRKWLGAISLLGGISAIPLMIAFNLTGWGEPGTSTYQTYELLNHLMSVALLLMIPGWVGLALLIPTGYFRWGAILALIGAISMLVGNAVEFWLFSDQPYGDSGNLRNASWTAFSIGSLVMDAGATLSGYALWRTNAQPRWIGALLMLTLPLDVIAFITFSPLLAPAVLALALGWWLVKAPDQPMVSSEILTPSS